MDDHDVVDGLGDLREHVARDKDRPPLARERAQEVAEPADSLRVEAVGGLVEDEHLGIAEQRRCEAEALAHPERVALHAPPARLSPCRPARAPRRRVTAGCHRPAASTRRWFRPERPGARRTSRAGRRPVGPAGRARDTACRERWFVPAVGRTSPRIARIVVDFPAPFGPRKPVIVPGFTENVRSSTASVEPNRLLSPTTSITRGR